jgi:hypothetical protein
MLALLIVGIIHPLSFLGTAAVAFVIRRQETEKSGFDHRVLEVNMHILNRCQYWRVSCILIVGINIICPQGKLII